MSTRSYQGCWTCKRRRRRCDNARPTCQNCAERGVVCEGYEVRLRWGSGIASRGYFTGAAKPVKGSAPSRPRGRQRDLSRERKKRETEGLGISSGSDGNRALEDSPTNDEQVVEDEVLFNKFMNDGINALHSTTARDSMLHDRLPQLCQESSALYSICIAFQLALTSFAMPRFCEYFDTALGTFRSELARSTTLSDGTLTSGLLLCSIGLMHGLPWTMHLEGMHNILQSHGLNDTHRPSTPTHFRIHLLEVMGVMDLASFSIGRQSPRIGIWRRYCQPAAPRYGIEPVSGIPRTLLDIFAGIGAEATEQTFWDWPGEPGSFLQCYLWEAHRLAGILALRRETRASFPSQGDTSTSAWRQPARCPADTTVLVTRIMASLDAMRLAFIERPTEDAFIKNATIFPMFVAGLEVSVLCRKPEWQQAIRKEFSQSHQCQILLSLLEELWRKGDPAIDIHELARSKGLEMGLL
ncbi:hypothetical protein N7499_007390 [Penicillium canescens]|uniref:Zn(2)-C6 fungal-type domain-containing protein n=1 Tax=Penicillium canescens TaxID=5083 RepID=A0AAD6IFW6_PENCN|nr:uncharacterized protein N7446_003080 [Penicillium canescens]KAJ6044886.1 hypothetical protein N7460_006241 [Penicillium canescens]KAJ6056355.1 hypothetical protein N7444_005453 [Penicillium canescens]KAJ6075303.1 hypothetical protein N7446_003080 [Penicillium canescens]KAJ6082516.1 hypothetical protein N7499_007390 [Penicillium canescens]KAJ6175688.1 hypothetical protein N7485_002602 [Penicillium canescens]